MMVSSGCLLTLWFSLSIVTQRRCIKLLMYSAHIERYFSHLYHEKTVPFAPLSILVRGIVFTIVWKYMKV